MKYFVCLLLLLSGCTPEDKRLPGDVLPLNEMKAIVWDLMLAGDYASMLLQQDSSDKTIATGYMLTVFKNHKTDKKTFYKSFDFYQSHPLINQVLYDSLYEYATRKRAEIFDKYRQSSPPAVPLKSDSALRKKIQKRTDSLIKREKSSINIKR